MELTINVKQNAGTVAWVTDHLANLEVELRRDKAGSFPYLAYRAKWEEKPATEGEPSKQVWYKLALPQMEPGQAPDTWGYEFFMREDKRHCIRTVWPVKNENRWGMFSYLTKAAHTVVSNFLAQVADAFQNYLDSDEGEAEFEVKISQK